MLLCWGSTAALTFVALRSVFARVWAELAAQALKCLRANTSPISIQAIHTLIWKGGDFYVWIQTNLYPRKETICLSFFFFFGSDRLSGRSWKRCFKEKTFLMVFLCCSIFYLSLQFLWESSELGHYTVLCKLKEWEWTTQPCLYAVC